MAIDKIQSESINLADNFAFTGTVSGAGGNKNPAFASIFKCSTRNIRMNTYVLKFKLWQKFLIQIVLMIILAIIRFTVSKWTRLVNILFLEWLHGWIVQNYGAANASSRFMLFRKMVQSVAIWSSWGL